MTTENPWPVIEQYGPLIISECERVWKSAVAYGDFMPCELRDVVQSARLYIAEKWCGIERRSPSPAPLVRIMAKRAALLCLRQHRKYPTPVDTMTHEQAA